MKQHLPVGFWEQLFKDINRHNFPPDVGRRSLKLSTSTFYRKYKQYNNGGILPRKPGSGRKRIYHPKDYEPLILELLKDLPPVIGHRRIWMAMKRKGVPFSQGTSYNLMKELGLLVPKRKGRCRKKYKALKVDGPDEVWVADTTTWWLGRHRVEIYLCLDAYSRWIPSIMVSLDRTAKSTVRYYEKMFHEGVPKGLHTDNGPEFKNKNALAYLDERDVHWRHGPSHTPEAQGLVERLVKTLKEEWLMWKDPADTIELQECLDEFRRWYNELRDHSALNYQVPEVVYYA